MKLVKLSILILIITFITALTACNNAKKQSILSKESLGQQIFNDTSLSKDGTQACASCHDPEHAFTDSRVNPTSIANKAGAVSTGQDEKSLGDINAPTAAYAAFVPEFHFDTKEGLYMGGMFLNGRSANMTEQAKQPFLNPAEMQTTKEEVVTKVKAKYGESMKSLYGDDIFDSTDAAFHAIADSIVAFESTKSFASFDSKFDKVLRGEATLTAEEQLGLDLFKDEKKANCAACHPVPDANSSKADSLFTDFTYDNLGVPKNSLVRAKNGKGTDYVDVGLFDNPEVDDPELKGAFRVSSLRNIAVTAPYMHNGVFNDLATVVHFYNSRDVKDAINPETNKPWAAAEIDATKNTDELGDLGLSDKQVKAIVAFLKTLTDERYEHLIPEG